MIIVDEKCTFVISSYQTIDGISQAYLVATGDFSKSLETAKNWARKREWNPETRIYTYLDTYEIYETDNKDFEISIYDSAGGSSQGGKLSFWNCLIRKDGKEFLLGIQADSLCELLKVADFHKGVCQESVSIYRNKMVKVARTQDVSYDKVVLSGKKTSKWEKGKVYRTKTLSSICLGEVYAPLNLYTEWGHKDYSIFTIDFDVNKKRKGYLDGNDINFDRPSKVSLVDKYNPRQVYDDIQYSDEDLENVLQNLRDIIYSSEINIYSDIDYIDKLMYSYDGEIKDKDRLIQRLQHKIEMLKNEIFKNNKRRVDYKYIVRTIKNGETVDYEFRSGFERTLKITELILDFVKEA
jgi:hypothetical protein